MISYYKFQKTRNEFDGSLKEFIRDENNGITAWVSHTKSWLDDINTSQRLHIIRFKELKNNTYRPINKLFKRIGFDLSKESIKGAINKLHISNMSEIEKFSGGYSYFKYKSFDFVRKGKKGGRESFR